jgi:drug/metabolite transporter (DMT)-like permease
MEDTKAKSKDFGRERHRVRSKTIFLILLVIIFGPVSTVLFRIGMEHMRGPSAFTVGGLLHYGWRMLTNEYLVIGTSSRILATLSTFLVLTWADYSFVSPASSLNYGIVALLGYAVLGERVSPGQWAGIALICAGVLMVSITPVSTTQTRVLEGQIFRSISPGLDHERNKRCQHPSPPERAPGGIHAHSSAWR